MDLFENNFWGEKHNGFNVLLLNATKHRQTSVKELADFFRDFIAIQDDYQKHFNKLASKVSTYGSCSTFSLLWSVIQSSTTALLQLQAEFLQKLQDVYRETMKYWEDQNRAQKQMKENENKTLDAVNLMQTTTTCLQKSKETYVVRFLEHEKTKKENVQKEISKSETKLKKTCDEYRHYVDKYAKVKEQFEDRMTLSCKNFQTNENQHLDRIKKLMTNYAATMEVTFLAFHEAAFQMHSNLENVLVDDMIRSFMKSHATGTEKPCSMLFEEQPDIVQASVEATAPGADAVAAFACSSASAVEAGISESALASASANSWQSKKLSLWIPGRKNRNAQAAANGATGNSSKPATPSSPPAFTAADTDTYVSPKNLQEFAGTTEWPQNHVCSLLDTEHKIDFKNDTFNSNWPTEFNEQPISDGSSSSADSEDERENAVKLNFTIRDKGSGDSRSVSVDQLKDVLKDMKFETKPRCKSRQDRMRPNAFSQEAPSFLRPAKTGDDWFNTRLFAGAVDRFQIESPQVFSGAQRPCSSTPTPIYEMSTQELPSANATLVSRFPLAAALTETLHALLQHSDADVASIGNLKIYGSLTLSFPCAVVEHLDSMLQTNASDPRLTLQFENASRIHAIVPNCQVLPNQSSFSVLSTRELVFSRELLGQYLSRRRMASPNSSFFNVDVLRYEVRLDRQNDVANLPLTMKSFWKCQQPEHADIVVQFSYNSQCHLLVENGYPDLVDIVFTTEIQHVNVSQAQLKPEGLWDKENSKLVWKVDRLGHDAAGNRFLKARLNIKADSALVTHKIVSPSPTYAQFSVAGILASMADICLQSSPQYRLSMVKKKLVSGRYLCEPRLR